jgi:ATP-dependent DNA helicase 2 subunit 2
MIQAVSELGKPRIKNTRPVPSYKGILSLGDPEKYDSAMCIDVERYPRTMVARPKGASNFVVLKEEKAESTGQSSHTMKLESQNEERNGLEAVKNNYKYLVPDGENADGKKEVQREELAKGYTYGRTAVPISESEQNITKLETKASLTIIGFIPNSSVSHDKISYLMLS